MSVASALPVIGMHELLAVIIPIRLLAHPMYRMPLSSSSAAALLPATPPRLAVGDFAATLLPCSALRLAADFPAFLFIGLPTDIRDVPGVSSGIRVPDWAKRTLTKGTTEASRVMLDMRSWITVRAAQGATNAGSVHANAKWACTAAFRLDMVAAD
jgi:hypothetical protein